MWNLLVIFTKSLLFWKYEVVSMQTDNGLFFVGIGKKDKVARFQQILEEKHLAHINQYLAKHG
jgi:hypothetical protein